MKGRAYNLGVKLALLDQGLMPNEGKERQDPASLLAEILRGEPTPTEKPPADVKPPAGIPKDDENVIWGNPSGNFGLDSLSHLGLDVGGQY